MSPWSYGNSCFLVAICCLIIRRPNLEVAIKRLPSTSNNTMIVLVPCSRMKVHSYTYFLWRRYFWGPWVSFVRTAELSVRVRKITPSIIVSWAHSLLYYFQPILNQWNMVILWKRYKSDNFESHDSLNFSFANIRGLHSNFVDCEFFLWIKLSWHSCSKWN